MKELSLFFLSIAAGGLVAVVPPGVSAQASRADSCHVTTESSRVYRNDTKEVTETRSCPLGSSDCGQMEQLCSNRVEQDFKPAKGAWE
jgi:hypothetical protein